MKSEVKFKVHSLNFAQPVGKFTSEFIRGKKICCHIFIHQNTFLSFITFLTHTQKKNQKSVTEISHSHSHSHSYSQSQSLSLADKEYPAAIEPFSSTSIDSNLLLILAFVSTTKNIYTDTEIDVDLDREHNQNHGNVGHSANTSSSTAMYPVHPYCYHHCHLFH